jgi:transcriptional regulator with XRE-family HTH domain
VSPSSNDLSRTKQQIAAKVRQLRKGRNWTQAELAEQLHLSQNRLSEIERGDGSFTAEQFLLLLKLFNVASSHFIAEPAEVAVALQNALARLGALHLQESAHVLPSEELGEVHDVVREALLDGSPRLVTALAPVFVRNGRRLNLNKLHGELEKVGRQRRLSWTVENTLSALASLASDSKHLKEWAKLYTQPGWYLQMFLDFVAPVPGPSISLDILDATIRSKRTLEDVERKASKISRRWGIVTSLQPEDFIQALEAARAAH